MNERYPEDLISAYFDGEVSPVERAQAEQRLADSVDVRRELSEYGQLSSLLASLPKSRVPEEFRASVLQAAERATLLPSRDVAPVASQRPSRRKRRFWGVATSVVVVAATLVIVMVNWLDRPAAERGVAMQQPSRTAGRTTTGISADRADYDSVAAEPLDEARVASASLSKTEAMTSAPLPAASVAERDDKSPAVVKTEPERSNLDQPQLKFDDEVLSDAAIGEVVEALATADDQIAVVKLTVVDRRRGLESLQLLLARNEIPLETPAVTSDLSANSAAESENLLAVYVETNSSQMSSALLDLQHEDLFREVAVQEPIQVASLDSTSQSLLGYTAASSGVGGGGFAMSALRPGQRRSQVSGTARAAKNKDRALEEAETPDAGEALRIAAAPHRELARAPVSKLRTRKEALSDGKKSAVQPNKKSAVQPKPKQASRPTETPGNQQVAHLSRQMVLSVPTDLLPVNPPTQKSTGQRLRLLDRERELVAETKRLSQKAGATGGSAVATRPLQILFVLVSNAPM